MLEGSWYKALDVGHTAKTWVDSLPVNFLPFFLSSYKEGVLPLLCTVRALAHLVFMSRRWTSLYCMLCESQEKDKNPYRMYHRKKNDISNPYFCIIERKTYINNPYWMCCRKKIDIKNPYCCITERKTYIILPNMNEHRYSKISNTNTTLQAQINMTSQAQTNIIFQTQPNILVMDEHINLSTNTTPQT